MDEDLIFAQQQTHRDVVGAQWLQDRLTSVESSGPILIQGPVGSILLSQPAGEGVPAAHWNLSEPEEIERIHELYRIVGAEVMLSNTFQASAPVLERDGVSARVERVNERAVRCALHAAAPCVLGSVGSCGIPWTVPEAPEYRLAWQAYYDQAQALLNAGAHGLMIETITSLHELEPALDAACEAAEGLPVLVSFAVNDEGNLMRDGLNIEAACMWAQAHGAFSVGVNCCSLKAAHACVSRMHDATELPLSVRPSAGAPYRDEDGMLVWHENPEAFAQACLDWCEQGVALVGSCCGTTAKTTNALALALDERCPDRSRTLYL